MLLAAPTSGWSNWGMYANETPKFNEVDFDHTASDVAGGTAG